MMDQRTPYAEVSASRDVPHESATLHVTGRADYTDDLPIPEGALHAALEALSRVNMDLGMVLVRES